VEIIDELPNFLYNSEGGVSMAHVNDPEPPRYYDWMLWKMRQERAENPTLGEKDIYRREIAEMQKCLTESYIRITELKDEIRELKEKIENAEL